MDERYYIKIVDEGFYKFRDAITKIELKRRLNRILVSPRPYRWLSEDVDIDILLDCDEEPIILSRAEPVLPWNERVVSFQVNPESATIQDVVRMAEELVAIEKWPDPEDIIKMRVRSPTRKDWEQWTENMPTHSMSTRMQWEDQMKQWFLTMPGVPRAEKEPKVHSPREEGQGVPK